jgi:hypothetical protein
MMCVGVGVRAQQLPNTCVLWRTARTDALCVAACVGVVVRVFVCCLWDPAVAQHLCVVAHCQVVALARYRSCLCVLWVLAVAQHLCVVAHRHRLSPLLAAARAFVRCGFWQWPNTFVLWHITRWPPLHAAARNVACCAVGGGAHLLPTLFVPRDFGWCVHAGTDAAGFVACALSSYRHGCRLASSLSCRSLGCCITIGCELGERHSTSALVHQI